MMARPARVGLAVEVDRVTAVVEPRPTFTVHELAPYDGRSTTWPALAAFLQTFASATLDIVLLPPLVEARRVEMPRLKSHELLAVLTRDAGRFFACGTMAQVVAVAPTPQRMAVCVAAAPAPLIEAIHAAAHEARCTVRAIRAAHPVWAQALRGRQPRWRLALTTAHRVEVLAGARGRVESVRRCAPDIWDAARREALVAGVTVEPHGAACAARAAWHVGPTVGELLTLAARTDRRTRRMRRLTMTAAVSAACVLAGVVTTAIAGVHELSRTRAERQRIAAKVHQALATRESIESLDDRLSLLARQEGRTPWSDVIARVGAALPPDAHLLALKITGDTLVLDGRASHAVDSYEAIRHVADVGAVRSTVPVRRETGGDGRVADEHFTLALTMAPAHSAGTR